MSDLKEIVLTRADLDSLNRRSFSNSKLLVSNSRGSRVALERMSLDNCDIEVDDINESIVLRHCTSSVINIYGGSLKTIYLRNCTIDTINLITSPGKRTSILRYIEVLNSHILNLSIDTCFSSLIEDFSVYTSSSNTIGNLRVINQNGVSSSPLNLNIESSGITLKVKEESGGEDQDTISNSSLISKIYVENLNLHNLNTKRNVLYVSEVIIGPKVTVGSQTRLIPPTVFNLQTIKEVSPEFLSEVYKQVLVSLVTQYPDSVIESYGLENIFPNPLPLYISFYTLLRKVFLTEKVILDVNHPRVISELEVKNTCETILGQESVDFFIDASLESLKDFKKSVTDKYISTLKEGEEFDSHHFGILLNDIFRVFNANVLFSVGTTTYMKKFDIYVTTDGENYLFYKN